VSWALTEPGHGADLLAGEVAAVPDAAGGFRLNGSKWPINNATRGRALVVLARTAEPGGSRGFSLFLLDKAGLPRGSHRALPKVRTHGIRGADISGIRFEDTPVPASALLGAPGSGTETVLRGLQLTRSVCSALSTGAGEHALRLAVGFARERVIGDRPLVQRPYVRALLARSAGTLVAAEAAALLGIRSAHTLTGELSVGSALLKALAPTLVDGMIAELGELVGLRAHLVDGYAHGAFQKLRRDHGIVSIFDGSTVVNRNALINQFTRLGRGYARGAVDAEGLRRAGDLAEPVGPMPWAGLRLLTRGGCSPVQDLPRLVATLPAAGAPAELLGRAWSVLRAAEELHARMARLRPSARPGMPAFELAAGYELLYAAAACLHLWAANTAAAGPAPGWEGALWARAGLRELVARLQPWLPTDPKADPMADPKADPVTDPVADAALDDDVVGWLLAAVERDRSLSPFAILTGGGDR
jgi:hypothetical protein